MSAKTIQCPAWERLLGEVVPDLKARKQLQEFLVPALVLKATLKDATPFAASQLPEYRVWAGHKHEEPLAVRIVRAASAKEAERMVLSDPEVVALCEGRFPLYGSELVYNEENLGLLLGE